MRPAVPCRHAAKSPRARSVLLTSPLPPARPPAAAGSPDSARGWDPARGDVKLRMLSSPLRRCLLTNKVLPCDMMVRFELTRPPSPGARLVLQPSRILHPRFEDRPSRQGSTGKAMWVTCWADAVTALAQKGSYKRLHSSAVMPPPSAVAAHVHSLLARRVTHEADLLAERVKAWPAAWVAGALKAPVRRVKEFEIDKALRQMEEAGRRVLGVLDLSPHVPAAISDGADGPHPPPARFASTIALPPSHPVARHYRLSTFLSGVVLPPSASTSPTGEPQPPAAHLLAATRAPLDALLALLERRLSRLDAGAGAPSSSEGDLYVLSAPSPSPASSAEAAAAQRQAEDLVPLLVALERCRLWSGEGWQAEDD